MSNLDYDSTCHPERKRFRGELCKACYFRDRRAAAHSSATVAIQNSSSYIATIESIIDKRLKFLGIYPELVEGNGEFVKAMWAADGGAPEPKMNNPIDGIAIDLKQLRTKPVVG